MDEISLMREIGRLQEQINALRTIEIGGVWKDWTPTVTYTGGTTDPTSLTITYARYSIIGKICHIFISGSLVMGSGNRTSTLFSLPVNYSLNFTGSCVVTYASTDYMWHVYGSGGNKVTVSHGGMSSNGIIYVSAFYQIA
jgi:hypothetical protein